MRLVNGPNLNIKSDKLIEFNLLYFENTNEFNLSNVEKLRRK